VKAFLYNIHKKVHNQFNLFIWKHGQNYTKKSFTIVEQACHEVRGFRKMYEELYDKVRLSGQSSGTLSNYTRKPAQLSLHFGKLCATLPNESESCWGSYLDQTACPGLSGKPYLSAAVAFSPP
jgi:hypothetical protein